MYQVNEPLVVHDTIEDEVLVIRNDTGAYYSMLGPAADVWACIRAGLDEVAMVEVLASRYDAGADDLAASLTAFVGELLEAQLIRASVVASAASASAAGSVAVADWAGDVPGALEPRAPFTAPQLEVYTDMADLLLFDPIHEVTPEGWPHVVDGGA